MSQERNYGQIEYLDEIRTKGDSGECLSVDFFRYVRESGLDLRMTSQGGFNVYGHLRSCETCRYLSDGLNAKGY